MTKGQWTDGGPRLKIRVKDGLVHIFVAEGRETKIVLRNRKTWMGRSGGNQFVAGGDVKWKVWVVAPWRNGYRDLVVDCEPSFEQAYRKLERWLTLTPMERFRWTA